MKKKTKKKKKGKGRERYRDRNEERKRKFGGMPEMHETRQDTKNVTCMKHEQI